MKDISKIFLVIFNLIPLIGVFFYGWSPFNILFLYWLESAVIGFYNILKIIKVMNFLSIIIVPFFIVHFGGFMFGHLFILDGFFNQGTDSSLFRVITGNLYMVWPVVVLLFISHGISFVTNFLGKKEYLNYAFDKENPKKSKDIMFGPYNRIILMHLAIIFGGWLTIIFESSVWVLVLLVFIKVFIDLRSHIREHSYALGPDIINRDS